MNEVAYIRQCFYGVPNVIIEYTMYKLYIAYTINKKTTTNIYSKNELSLHS